MKAATRQHRGAARRGRQDADGAARGGAPRRRRAPRTGCGRRGSRARRASSRVARIQRSRQAAACSPGSGRARWRAPRRARRGSSADLVALPVVLVEARIGGVPRTSRPPSGSSAAALPEPVRAGPGGVRVGVVEPVLDVGPPAAPDTRVKRWPAAPACRAVGVEVAVVGGVGARGLAAAAVVHRKLALARLVDEPGRVLAHECRVAGAVGRGEPAPAAWQPPRTAHTMCARKPPNERPSKPPCTANSAPKARQQSNRRATNSTLAWPRWRRRLTGLRSRAPSRAPGRAG